MAASPSAALSASLETPLHFESAGKPLYGVYYTPRRAREGAPVVVHVHGLGVEQIALYREETLAARAAAALGFPVFRWHARGHGDSSGDFADVTLATLDEDARAAAHEARRRSGAARVIWLGVRFGTLTAARLAGEPGVAGLVMWEPVHRPPDYFRGMLRGMLFSQVAEGKRPDVDVDQLLERLTREGRVDVHGYYLHRAIADSARDADLGRLLEHWSGPTLIAQIAGRPRLSPPNAALASAMGARGGAVDTLCVTEEPGWHFIQNPAWENEPLVHRTATWLDAQGGGSDAVV